MLDLRYEVWEVLGANRHVETYRCLQGTRELGVVVWREWEETNYYQARAAAEAMGEYVESFRAAGGDGQNRYQCFCFELTGTVDILSIGERLQSEAFGKFAPGAMIRGEYRVIAIGGRGGQGIVYRATDDLGRDLAIKVCPGGTQRLRDEAQQLAMAQGLYVCQMHAFFRLEERACDCMVSEWLDGVTLDRLTDPTLEMVYEIAIGMAEGLAAIHRNAASLGVSLLHLDIKPANVMYMRGQETAVKLLDFGVARQAGTAAGGFGGTRSFASPEQLREEALTTASDLFSMGATLYRLISGRLPFGRRGPEVAGPMTPIGSDGSFPETWAPLFAIVEKLMEWNPADRIGTARETAEALRRARQKSLPAEKPVFIDTDLFLAMLQPLEENASEAERTRQRMAAELFQRSMAGGGVVSSELVVFEVIDKLVEWEYGRREVLDAETQAQLRVGTNWENWENLDAETRWNVHKILEPKFEGAEKLFAQVRYGAVADQLIKTYPTLAKAPGIDGRDTRVVTGAVSTGAGKFATGERRFHGELGTQLLDLIHPMEIAGPEGGWSGGASNGR